MTFHDRFQSFVRLGMALRAFGLGERSGETAILEEAADTAGQVNPWFTPYMIRAALLSLGEMLQEDRLADWLAPYAGRLGTVRNSRTVGVVMAGNIPAVGFHDFLCVLLAGHRLLAKVSASDTHLLPAMAAILADADPRWIGRYGFTDSRLERFDAVIATGNNNTAQHMARYFGKYPHIIRGHRNGVAVLTGGETSEELSGLASDILLYFGMGCRNVSKIYLPKDYNLSVLAAAFAGYGELSDHHRYRNNLDYNRSLLLVGRVPFFDAGVVLLVENPAIDSPVGVIHTETYGNLSSVITALTGMSEGIQCVVARDGSFPGAIPFGRSQKPGPGDYADGTDTMEFLLGLPE